MDKEDYIEKIIEKVIEIYFRDNCSVKEALSRAKNELEISNAELIYLA